MLTLEAEPVRGGSVAGEGNYSHSAEIPIIATQYEGYRFVNWTEAGEEISIDSNFTYTMPDRDVSLIAYFEPGHIPVTYSAYWPLDEGTGAIASDRAGSYDGSVINPKWIQCQDRGYLLFDGTSYVNIEGNPNLKPVSAVSFETWVYPTEYRTAKVIQMRDWDGHGLDLNLWKGWQGGVNHGPSAKTTIDWAPSDANRRPDLFTWYHMALVYDNATLKLYVDGVLEKSQPLTGALHIWSFNPPIRIGSEGGQKFFKGSIANVGYSTDAFTATEIAARAANPPGGCPPEVHFTAVPAHGQIPLTVSFTDTSTRMPYAWSWSFGDGNTSTEQNPVHTYENAGTYTVTLQATNIFGTASSTQEYYIHAEGVVEPGNLLINPSFLGTVGLRPDSWQGTSRITSEAVNGNNIVMDASDGGGFLRQSVDDIDTDKAYTLSFYAKKNGTINSGWSQLAFYDDGGMYIGACVIVHNFADVLQDDWQKLEGTCHTIPANTGSIRVEIVRGLSTTGTDALFVHSPALVTA